MGSSQPQPQHTTTKMSHRHPTLHRLCHLSPWAGYRRPQPMAPGLPMVPHTRRLWSGLAARWLVHLFWGENEDASKKERDRGVLALGGQNFEEKTQQSNRSRRPRWEGYWGGGAAWVERVGGRYCIDLGGDSNDEKKQKKNAPWP